MIGKHRYFISKNRVIIIHPLPHGDYYLKTTLSENENAMTDLLE